MKRSGKVLIVCHCLLNANAKVPPLASTGGVYAGILQPFIGAGVGIAQLPCPELTYLGMNRWGMTKEQYDNPCFRSHCERLLEPMLQQVEGFVRGGYAILGVIGMDGSPNCGVSRTCLGFTGGEIGADVARQVEAARMVEGEGVFMEMFREALEKRGINIPFRAVDEEDPSSIHNKNGENLL